MTDTDDDSEDAEPRRRDPRYRRGFAEQLLTGLLDPEGTFRKGQDLFSGLTQATKDEIMRLVSAEVRSFLKQVDAVDLLREVIAGLELDVKTTVRFARRTSGELEAVIDPPSIRVEPKDPRKADTKPRSNEPPSEAEG